MRGGTGQTGIYIDLTAGLATRDRLKQCRPDPSGEPDWVLQETEVIAGDLEDRPTVAFGKNHAGP
jgi:hypothetical protein